MAAEMAVGGAPVEGVRPPVAEDASATAGLGILMMLLGIFLFVCNDVMGKWLVATYSVGQVLLIRSLFALLLLAPAILREGVGRVLAPARPGMQLLRIVFSTAEVAAFYWAVAYLPLADVVTFYLSGPIWVTALAGPLLGEKVGWRRWSAVLVGFAGVVIAMRPSEAAFGLPALVAVSGSLLFALLMITTRKLRDTSGTTLVTWQVLGALIFGAVLAPVHWVTPTPRDFLLLGMLGVVATVAHICVNKALKLASAAVVVPYQYTQIAWAVLLGWIVFGDIPEAAVFVGSSVIVAAGLYIFLREQQIARQARRR
ncbi:DMT family transporter [Alsobacter soli]|nr:DMT family transporter [Alsobacter soli]